MTWFSGCWCPKSRYSSGCGAGSGSARPWEVAAPAVLGKDLTAWRVSVPSQRGPVPLVYTRRWGPFHLSVPSSSTRHRHCPPPSWGRLALLITPRLGCKHRLLQDLCPRLGGQGPPCAPASPTVSLGMLGEGANVLLCRPSRWSRALVIPWSDEDRRWAEAWGPRTASPSLADSFLPWGQATGSVWLVFLRVQP